MINYRSDRRFHAIASFTVEQYVSRGSVGNWWEAGGADNCVVAYQAKGAASYAASLVNLANPGTNDAVTAPSCNAPDWTAANGWDFDATNTEALRVGGMTTNAQRSYIISLVGVDGTPDTACAIGDAWSGIYAVNYGSVRYLAQSGGFNYGSELGTAVLALTPASGYRDGSNVGNITTMGTLGRVLAIGTEGVNSTTVNTSNRLLTGYITALAIYSDTLSDTEVAAITTAMAAL